MEISCIISTGHNHTEGYPMWHLIRLVIILFIGLSISSEVLAARGGARRGEEVRGFAKTCFYGTLATSDYGYGVWGVKDARAFPLAVPLPILSSIRFPLGTYLTLDDACWEVALRRANVEEASTFLWWRGVWFFWFFCLAGVLFYVTISSFRRKKSAT